MKKVAFLAATLLVAATACTANGGSGGTSRAVPVLAVGADAVVNPDLQSVAKGVFAGGEYSAYYLSDSLLLFTVVDRVSGKSHAIPVAIATQVGKSLHAKNAGVRLEQLLSYEDGSGVWAAYSGNRLLGFFTRSAEGNWNFFSAQGGSAQGP